MNTRNHFILALSIVGTTIFLTPAISFAWEGRHDARRDSRYVGHGHYSVYHHHYSDHHFGSRVRFLPFGSFSIRLGDIRFFYNNGRYYRPYNGGYTVVRPPYGVVIHTIPSHFRRVLINGNWYHTDNDVYYINTTYGYQVVPSPVLIAAPNQTTTVTTTADDAFYTVNIPNEKAGGYTPVTLKRLDNGFVGPQGEFYPEFPQVAQLKAMYIK